MARKQVLHCWLDGMRVAEFTANRGWDLRCRYTSDALDRWPSNTPVLSCSLPVRKQAQDASAFLRGLLPEGNHLQEAASRAGVPTNDTHALLARYGREVAGALVITTEVDVPDTTRWAVEPYTEESLATEIQELGPGLGLKDDSELSLAGLQNKLLLVRMKKGGWGRPVNGHPSTHILKIDDERFPGLVSAEAAALSIARNVGLGDLDPRIADLGGRECLIVKRYDRALESDGTVTRVHQEDACQAMAVSPDSHRGRGKYEQNGGPSLAQIANLLTIHASDPAAELEQLLRLITFTTLIRNADCHGKNLSFIYEEVGHPRVAPVYDSVPTALWPSLRSTSAMSVAGVVNFDAITPQEILSEAAAWGLGRDAALKTVRDTTEQIRASAAVADHEQVVEVVTATSRRMLDQMPGER